MRSWAGTVGGKEGRSACCVVMSVKVSAMCCGSVLPIISVEVISQLSYRIFLGNGFRISSMYLDSQGSLPWRVVGGKLLTHLGLFYEV